MIFLSTDQFIIITILILVVIISIWFVGTMKRLRQLDESAKEAEQFIETALIKRVATLRGFLKLVNGYVKDEVQSLKSEGNWDIELQKDSSINEKETYFSLLNQVTTTINMMVEKYPAMKDDKDFEKMYGSMLNTEELLQTARRTYNAIVSRINTDVVTFPSTIVARIVKVEKRSFFEVEVEKRQDI